MWPLDYLIFCWKEMILFSHIMKLASTYTVPVKTNVGDNGFKCPRLHRWYEIPKLIGMHAKALKGPIDGSKHTSN